MESLGIVKGWYPVRWSEAVMVSLMRDWSMSFLLFGMVSVVVLMIRGRDW